MLTLVNVSAALLLALGLYITHSIINNIRHAYKARQLGCKTPIRGFSRDISGMSMLKGGVKSAREQRAPDFLEDEVDRLSQVHGRQVTTFYMYTAFFRRRVVTIDPRNIQTILASNFKDYGLGDIRINNFKPLLGDGIFATNGKKWEHSRALLRPQFVRSQISDISLEERHLQTLMSVLDSRLGYDRWTEQVDLSPIFFNFTLDTATEFLFGESVHSQKRTGNGSLDFGAAFDKAQYIMSIANRMGSNYWMAHTKDFHATVKIVHDFIDSFVQKTLARQAAKEATDEKSTDDRYIFLEALAEQTQNPVELRNEVINILLAGRDTTASTLGWFFFTMAQSKNKQTFQRLRTIILDEFGTYTNPKTITFETLKNCEYLQWCLNELLRLYPAVPLNGRGAVKDTVLPKGGGPDGESPIYIKKGDEVSYWVHIMHRRKDIYGPDAQEYRPERWEKRRSGWHYLPFNGGPRICIGQQFALTEVAYVIVRMMQRIDDIDGTNVGPRKHGLTLTNSPGQGVKVRLHFAAE